jgi:hypothetical protein
MLGVDDLVPILRFDTTVAISSDTILAGSAHVC